MRRLTLFALLLPLGCGEKDPDPTDDSTVEADADADADADTDSDSDADADTDSDADSDVTGVAISASATELDADQTVSFTLTATTGEGDSDVSAEAEFSADEAVLRFYSHAVGQPVGAGTITVTGAYAGYEDSVEVTIQGLAPASGDLVLNELLTDGAVEGDPNGDGELDATGDEYVEIVNTTDYAIDLSGVTLEEQDYGGLPRHTFSDGDFVGPRSAAVVFGGGSADSLSVDNARFFIAENEDPGTSNGLALSNDGDALYLYAADGTTLAFVAYGEADFTGSTPAVQDASLTRDPDITGSWVSHDEASGADGAYSPGTQVDGSGFEGPDAVYGSE